MAAGLLLAHADKKKGGQVEVLPKISQQILAERMGTTRVRARLSAIGGFNVKIPEQLAH